MNSESIKFHPFVGDSFGSQPARILILGESHYETDGSPEFTRSVVNEWIKEPCIRYFNTLARLLTNQEPWNINRHAMMQKVSFYNFVQVEMETRKCRPSSSYDELSVSAFREVLVTLEPTHVISTGKTLWGSMPWGTEQTDAAIDLNGRSYPLRYYLAGSNPVPTLNIQHLSRASGFSLHPVIKAFLPEGFLPLKA